jgi:hypothetical protein
MDDARHPALLIVDMISSLGSVEYNHDEWSVDVTIWCFQKGMTLPPGLGINAISEKALAASRQAVLPRSYWDWPPVIAAGETGMFPYTPATNLLVGLREALAMFDEEGLPAVFARHNRFADRANGVPNRGGMFAIIGLQFDPAQSDDPGAWLTVCPPACWDMSWEDFIADTCHAMFGFEKPRWHYMPELGALLDALGEAARTLPGARSRFLRGDLPPGGQLMVRYEAADTDELRWARVESWEGAGHAIIRDTGRNSHPGWL